MSATVTTKSRTTNNSTRRRAEPPGDSGDGDDTPPANSGGLTEIPDANNPDADIIEIASVGANPHPAPQRAHAGGNGDENDPDDPDDGGNDPNAINNEDLTRDPEPNLAAAIQSLARAAQQGFGTNPDTSRSKVREPDTFNGEDPKKLRAFLMQLQLNFADRPRAFNRDDRKVNFAISYLKGPCTWIF